MIGTVKIKVEDAISEYEFEIPVEEWLHLKRKMKAMNEQTQRDKFVGLKRLDD